MTEDRRSRATAIVASFGDEAPHPGSAAEALMPLVYDELRRLAGHLMRRERPGHTLQPTALVNEAFIRLVDQTRVNWQGRTHFRAVGARVMRRILVDHARGQASAKRGGGSSRVTLEEPLRPANGRELELADLLSLEEALKKLASLDARQARVVELRFFGGLTTLEIATVLGVSSRTVEGDWAHARAWLRRELTTEGGR